MSNRIKSSIFVVAVVAFFLIVSWVMDTTSADTIVVNIDEQPAEINKGNASIADYADYAESPLPPVESITKADKATTLQPWDIEILMEQAINKADNGERVAPQATTLQAWDIEILMEQALNKADDVVTSEAETGLTQP